MSDNEDLLGDDLGDHSLADYNLGNEEEEQLLADDYDCGASQNVPSSVGSSYAESVILPSSRYSAHEINYSSQPVAYPPLADTECVVPNITVEVPNTPLPEHSTYAPYEPPPVRVYEEHAVPPAIPAAPIESPQIVPSEIVASVPNGDGISGRERFISERPAGAQRMPRIRDIPDSLDKVFVPRGGYNHRGRTSWRNPQFQPRYSNPYRRNNNPHWGNNFQSHSFAPPDFRPNNRLDIRAETRHGIRQEIQHDIRRELCPDIRPELRPDARSELHPGIRSEIHPEIRPELNQDIRSDMRPDIRSQLHPDQRPEISADNISEFRSDNRPEFRSESRPEFRSDNLPEFRSDIRPEFRSDNRPEFRLDNRPEFRSDIRSEFRPDNRPEFRLDNRPGFQPDNNPDFRPDMRSEIHPDTRQQIRPELRPDIQAEPPIPGISQMGPEMSPERPTMSQDMANTHFKPPFESKPPFNPNFQRFPQQPFRPLVQEHRPNFGPNIRPNFGPRQLYPFQRPPFNPGPFIPPMREIVPNNASHIPQITIRQALPRMPPPNMSKMEEFGSKIGVREPEVRMLPVQLPPAGLAGKKVLINPHFKGNFQPPVEGLSTLPTYIPTRIQKSPPLSPTLENKFGPIKDIDDAAERFIAEQRNALARAANRKLSRRSPQRYIENTTIEIENDLARRDEKEDDLLRRQEQFINDNRAGLRRRMRSPSPPVTRRSPSPLRALSPPASSHPPPRRDDRRPRASDRQDHSDEESDYRRGLREQERLRERVLRAKEVRRRKNAVALQKQIDERERERLDKEKENQTYKPVEANREPDIKPTSTEQDSTTRPDTTRKSPERMDKIERVEKKIEKVEKAKIAVRDRSPVKKDETAEVNSTCDTLTPPRAPPSPRALTPPLPAPPATAPPAAPPHRDSDDDLDLILDDIDDILSDDDDTGRFKEKSTVRTEPAKSKPHVDLRSKLPPKMPGDKKPRAKIIFNDDREHKNKEKSPPRKAVVTSSTKTNDNDNTEKRNAKIKPKQTETVDVPSLNKRQRITFERKQAEKEEKPKQQPFPNRRVVLQRKVTQPVVKEPKSVFSRIEIKTDPTKPNPGIFSRAVRTAIGADKNRIIIKKSEEPVIEYESESDIDEDKLLEDDVSNVAMVTNLPHGMTDTRLKTLAGNDVQSLVLDKEDRSAKITFKTTVAAETFKKKFNSKMVAASRLTVVLQ